MSTSLAATWQVLTRSGNETVTDALLPLLDSPDRGLVAKCVQTLARRRDPVGHRAILARFETFDEPVLAALAELPGRMTDSLRGAITGGDAQLFKNALCAACRLDEYETISALVEVVERDSAHADWAAATLLLLAEHLSAELSGKRRSKDHRDPQRMWGQALSSLHDALGRGTATSHPQIAQAYLLLTPRNSKTLRKILSDSNTTHHQVLTELFESSIDPAVVGHVWTVCMRAPAPQSVLDILGRRSDLPFIRQLLEEVAACQDDLPPESLQHVRHIEWIRGDRRIIDELDGRQQAAAAALAAASGVEHPRIVQFLGSIVCHGEPEGRRAACTALAHFDGAEADRLVLAALEDDCPEVQASAVAHLRERDVPDALERVVELLESPHQVVSDAACNALAEFTIARFRASFDEMSEETRTATGELVRKVDPTLRDAIRQDLLTQSRARRLRAIAMAKACRAVDLLERELLNCLEDEDHFIRAAAAEALGQSASSAARLALQIAVGDRSVAVQQAARESLSNSLAQPETETAVAPAGASWPGSQQPVLR